MASHILCLNETKIKNIHIDPNNNIEMSTWHYDPLQQNNDLIKIDNYDTFWS
jgi:hypothetical protein